MKSYPEAPDLGEELASDGVIGVRRQRYDLLPTGSGTAFVPALELIWWDVTERRVRKETLPARTLTIEGSPPPTAAETGAATELSAGAPPPVPPDPEPEAWSAWPRWLTAGIVLLVIAAALARRRAFSKEKTASPPPMPPRAALRVACHEGSAAAQRSALQAWLRERFPAKSPAEAREAFTEAAGRDWLQEFDAHLYGQPAAPAPDGVELWNAIEQLAEDARPLRRKKNQEPLPTLTVG